jgi:thioredoxin reductase (NADPH)
MVDVIIIGAGPAGLTAAIYALRAKKSVLVFESNMVGGQIVNTLDIENYPSNPHISGYDFAINLKKQAEELGATIINEKVVSIENDTNKRVKTEQNVYEGKTIIIASGLENRTLNIPNELELVGKGVSFCATCDGNFFRGKDVAVVGGGNTALEDALYLSNIVNKVYLIHRRNEFRGDTKTVEQIKTKSNIELVLESTISSINGENALESIAVLNRDGSMRTILVSALFIAVGKKPNIDYLNGLINTDVSGFIISDDSCKTNIEGIFVAGDIREKKVRQLVTATSDGAVAALEAINYLNNN